jgi:glycyl-tRNA synthetase beta chain
VALLGKDAIPLEVLGLATGRATRGPRVLGKPRPAGLPLSSASDYEAALSGAGVTPSRLARREKIEESLQALADANGVRVVPDPDLLDEVADLVEYPGVVLGSFPEAFLELPREILATTLRHHQKAFSSESAGGTAAALFFSVADRDRDPAGHIRRGNEWVVGGRLEDARFFFQEDRKTPLEARLEKLGAVTFHAKGGSYRDKVGRIETIAASLAGTLQAAGRAVEKPALARAARLSKCDLVTGTVGEFPELQGVVGGLLLSAAGEPPAVSQAVADQYRPVGAEGELPRTVEGQLLAIADRLDSLKTLSGIAGFPTGTKDPFALRRAAFGIVRIVMEAGLPLSLQDLMDAAGSTDPALFQFLLERVTHWLRESGPRADTIQSVLGAGGARIERKPLRRLREMVQALESRRDLPEFAALSEMYKRCRNILEQAGEQASEGGAPSVVVPAAESASAENAAWADLVARVESVSPQATAALARDDFEAALDTVVTIHPALSRYFEKVLVMHPDAAVRQARLQPLRQTAAFIGEVADLARIQMSREEIQQKLASLARKESNS